MAERKVLSKYYPPDFDPSAIASSSKRSRKDGKSESKLSASRLMTPFSMKCTHCGEFIPKGRKFNARKQTLDERYLSIPIYRFHIRCTRCSGEITFRTDPKNNDYQCEHGAKRNFEVWRDETDEKYNDETEEQTLDRLEREHGAKEEQLERDKMAELEDKMLDSKREMQIADALDEIRTRNARIERNEARAGDAAIATVQDKIDEDALRAEREAAEDAEALRQFRIKQRAAKQAKLDEEFAENERRSAELAASLSFGKMKERRAAMKAKRLERKQKMLAKK
ncbi:unnamed protein product [Penicillium nalgiovense]|uniref:Splicing factor YJU2 n=1 Tax=Penicillium nalgiovense TaxID=60175 RepID=A0A1V6Y5N5_PENNA|nr:hypothetical protein PENNAL_c0035G09370 [Penicillium nalgiovense]CAG7960431.1 unnamed protein product [Penicillium nalgiovense]CAG7961819.1 unnamed protein product [Penicillium nalgiovense]CAG7980063.1 unnamed protein product [Penicillium nalgiovense]CAG7994247.1 unnamed protein product [Penicillium nalgiovense]